MGKLTKQEAKQHQQACDLLATDRPLRSDDQEFVLRYWQESQQSTRANTLAGAFFTPLDLAWDFALQVGGPRILDLGAGIGTLSWASWQRLTCWDQEFARRMRITCVEQNPDYIAVGRRVLPQADWVQADFFELPSEVTDEDYDYVIANPPFGSTPRTGTGPRYTGPVFEYHLIDLAATLAPCGVFILPQNSAPFRYSGTPGHREHRTDECRKFERQTGIELGGNIGIDTTFYRGWHGVRPHVEIVTVDLLEQELQNGTAPWPYLTVTSATTAIADQGEQLALMT